jgi:ABC-type dipeptide/oligopeptide/nickel transport system permease component
MAQRASVDRAMSVTPTAVPRVSAEIAEEISATRPPRRGRRVYRVFLGVAKRLGGSAAVILSVITVTFLVTRVFAPDPTNLFLGAAGNGFASAAAQAAARAKVRANLGLNGSLAAQYVRFLGQIVHGNLGISFQTGRTVTSDLLSRLPATAELAVYSLLFGVGLGVAVGVTSAVRRDGWLDRISRHLMVVPLAMPQFWVGLMLLWLFYTKLHLAPGPIGRLPIGVNPPPRITGFYVIDGILSGQWSTTWDAIRQLFLPVLTLGLGLAGPIYKVVRTSMTEALTSDYVRTAKALGFGPRRIRFVYDFKNGFLPVATILAGIIAYTMCGSILVEGVFGWTGVGNYALQAIQTSDFPAIQGFVLYGAILYVIIYEVLDSTYTLIDPRTRR